MEKYTVSYASGATGFGWEQNFKRLEDFEYFLKEKRYDRTAVLTVWDNEKEVFVFWKDAFSEPTVDMLANIFRDFRTTTRQRKFN